MSRWICIDDICIPSDENDWEELVAFADAIAEQEPIDICFCRECKYASNDGTYGCMCEHFNDTSDAYHRMWSDDFCSYGEVSEKPTGSEKPNNLERSSE